MRRASRARDQRGAVTLTVALTMTALMGVASLALDVGLQRVGVRDMQALSDVVALDLARHLDGRTAAVIDADPAWDSAMAESIDRNDDTLGDTPQVTTELGEIDVVAKEFVPVPSSAIPTAVRVTSSSSVSYVLRSGDGDIERSAVAEATESACFALGSYAARVRAGDSALLAPILGAVDSDLRLGLVDYQGLATADVHLGEVAVALGAGSVDELASTRVSASELYVAVAEALSREGDAAAAELLRSIAVKVTELPDITVGELVGLSSGGTAGFASTFNVLDLVTGAAFLADGDHAVDVEDLGVTLPAVGTGLTGDLEIIEAPRYACTTVDGAAGRTAETAQVRLDVHGSLASLPSLAVPLVGTLDATSAGMHLSAEVAQATGTLTDITCGNPTSTSDPEGVAVDVRTGLTDVNLGVPIRLQGDISVTGILGLVDVDILLRAGSALTPGDNTESIEYLVPPMQYGQAKETVNGGVGLPGATITVQSISARTLLGVPVTLPAATLDAILASVTSGIVDPVVTPVVTDVNNLLLGPLADALGLRLGGADLYLMDGPDCATPRLSG